MTMTPDEKRNLVAEAREIANKVDTSMIGNPDASITRRLADALETEPDTTKHRNTNKAATATTTRTPNPETTTTETLYSIGTRNPDGTYAVDADTDPDWTTTKLDQAREWLTVCTNEAEIVHRTNTTPWEPLPKTTTTSNPHRQHIRTIIAPLLQRATDENVEEEMLNALAAATATAELDETALTVGIARAQAKWREAGRPQSMAQAIAKELKSRWETGEFYDVRSEGVAVLNMISTATNAEAAPVAERGEG